MASYDYVNIKHHRARTDLSPTQVKALFTTPITLVNSYGSGTVVCVHRIIFGSTFNTTAYSGANNLEFRYTNGSGVKVTADIANTTLNFSSGTRYSLVAAVTPEIQPVANAPIVVAVPVANPTLGNSTITFIVEYTFLTLP